MQYVLATRLGDDAQVGGSATSEEDTIPVPKCADAFMIQPKTSGVILSFDGTTPTQTSSLRVPAGGVPVLIPFVPTPDNGLRIKSDADPAQTDYTIIWLERTSFA